MLKVGENSYCTLEEANKITRETYITGSVAAYWEALEDEKKELFLIDSAEEMERLPVAGIKLFHNQPLQFPRRSNFYRDSDIPREVKDAQVINAVESMLDGFGIPQEKGKVLTSAKAEKELSRWTSGGFKMRGYAR